jgi:hypothetical protein
MFIGEVQGLQDAAERNMSLLGQILPKHILSQLQGGNRVLVEKFQEVCETACHLLLIKGLMMMLQKLL